MKLKLLSFSNETILSIYFSGEFTKTCWRKGAWESHSGFLWVLPRLKSQYKSYYLKLEKYLSNIFVIYAIYAIYEGYVRKKNIWWWYDNVTSVDSNKWHLGKPITFASVKCYCLITLICPITLISHIPELLLIGRFYRFRKGANISLQYARYNHSRCPMMRQVSLETWLT